MSPPTGCSEALVLERIEPSVGRGERIRLGSAVEALSVGRSESSEIRLLTPTASRQHATLDRDSSGAWWITPAPGRVVYVDGEETSEPCLLEVGLNLRFGADHLRCSIESEDVQIEEPTGAVEGRGTLDTGLLMSGVGLLLVVCLGWILLSRTG